MSICEAYSSESKKMDGTKVRDTDVILDNNKILDFENEDVEFDDEWDHLYDEIDYEYQEVKRIKSNKKNNINW